MIRRFRHTLAPTVAALILAACGMPTLDEVRDAYKAQHPGYEVLSVEHGGVKDPANTYRIKYRTPGDPVVHTDLWRYDPVKQGEGPPMQPKDTSEARPAGKPGDPPRPAI